MKIAQIEQIPIAMPLAERYDNHARRSAARIEGGSKVKISYGK